MKNDLKHFITDLNVFEFDSYSTLKCIVKKLIIQIPKLKNKYSPEKIDMNYELKYDHYFKYFFSKIQKYVESSSKLNMKDRIELTNALASLFSFLKSIDDISDKRYFKYESTILHEFMNIFENYYLLQIKRYLLHNTNTL